MRNKNCSPFFPSKFYTFSTENISWHDSVIKELHQKNLNFKIFLVIAFLMFDIKQQSKALLKQLCSSHKPLFQLSNWRSDLNIVIESKVPQLSHFVDYVSGLKAHFFWNSWGFAWTCKWKTNYTCPVLFWCNCGWIFCFRNLVALNIITPIISTCRFMELIYFQ